ncbi:uncharacterized protein LOC128681785 isoform X1 [Plodia interpunctella]|uniref:uncharacterized protein LOC128681785 isoform X1 n=1 Tax=Plodia interpunctella TaxID=58824 RepID=UPI00236830AB|nr:uncharacterized protein LOC128681785 isoform X1 [Plodia interpunctella]XP_053621932.1 uncharacterized protein LOC128681785 isoform X1 [Plodia interpunctella]
MPELVEQMYCSQQIVIPPKFPYILKRYCKAAIKTQPYDLLRWSYEYFKALAQRREPPVKLRLEYPVYSTEGGLTRGCLKVLANQLSGMIDVPLPTLKSAWQGFCLDQHELKRIFCLCEVYMREDVVPFLHFIAVAAGLLTKSLTHTMILLCETLTREPDGGSAAIPTDNFLKMYRFLAKIDASKDVKYINGFREGYEPPPLVEEEEEEQENTELSDESVSDDFWLDASDLQRLDLIDDHVPRNTRLSVKMNMPIIGDIERSPSVERASEIERANYLRDRKGRAASNHEIDEKLRNMSAAKMTDHPAEKKEEAPSEVKITERGQKKMDIVVYDESNQQIPFEFYGEPQVVEAYGEEEAIDEFAEVPKPPEGPSPAEIIAEYVAKSYQEREERLEDLITTVNEIAAIVDRFKSANYDLGMVAGRQMSTTSGEFIVQHIEQEIMDYINEQIAILPDPDLKKKKAKPEEVQMIRELLETFLDENMDIIVPEIEEVEEEEQLIPDITQVYAVPGIGPVVDNEIIVDFMSYILEATKVQTEVVMPRNIRHFMCPPMEKYEEYKYEEGKQKEEVATGGKITD